MSRELCPFKWNLLERKFTSGEYLKVGRKVLGEITYTVRTDDYIVLYTPVVFLPNYIRAEKPYTKELAKKWVEARVRDFFNKITDEVFWDIYTTFEVFY